MKIVVDTPKLIVLESTGKMRLIGIAIIAIGFSFLVVPLTGMEEIPQYVWLPIVILFPIVGLIFTTMNQMIKVNFENREILKWSKNIFGINTSHFQFEEIRKFIIEYYPGSPFEKGTTTVHNYGLYINEVNMHYNLLLGESLSLCEKIASRIASVTMAEIVKVTR